MICDLIIKRLENKTHTYYVADGGPCKGLTIRVTPKGNKAFVLRTKINGQRKTKTIGTYGEIGLAEARKRGLKLRGQISGGEDIWDTKPKVEEQIATVQYLCDAYLQSLADNGTKRWTEIKRTLDIDCKSLYQLTARDVTPQQIADVIRVVVKRGSLGQATKVRTVLHAAYNFGMGADLDTTRDSNGSRFSITSNPVTSVPRPVKGATVRHRFLSEGELKRVWESLSEHANFNVHMAMKLILATGQRVTEVLNIRWEDIDDENLWTLPETKNGKPHTVPLSQTAIEILNSVKVMSGHLPVAFPQRNAIYTTMCSETLNKGVRRMCNHAGIEHFTPRDSRRTVKTLALKHGISKENMDRLQNHALTDVSSRHYVKYDFITEKRATMEAWDRVLQSILS